MSSNDQLINELTGTTPMLTRAQRKKLLEQNKKVELVNGLSDDELDKLDEFTDDDELETDLSDDEYTETPVKSKNHTINTTINTTINRTEKKSNGSLNSFPVKQNTQHLSNKMDDVITNLLAKYITKKIMNNEPQYGLNGNGYGYENGYDLNDGFVVPDDYVEYTNYSMNDIVTGNEDEDEDDYDSECDSDYEPVQDIDGDEEYENLMMNPYIMNANPYNKFKNMSKEEIELSKQYFNIINSKNDNTPQVYFMGLNINDKKKIVEQEKNISDQLMNSTPLRFQILNSNLPENVKAIAISKINAIGEEEDSADFYKIKEWLDGLIKIPFGKYEYMPISLFSPPQQIRDFLHQSGEILNRAIYGQLNTKTHIIQIISQLISNNNSIGNVFAVHGPMGTGKTSLVKNGIAKALHRPFTLISLGGMTDSSFLRGHSFTYEGARCGRIVEILSELKCMNPIIYFDELDKVSDTTKGEEIIHTLIHLTDKTQNMCFHDNYYSGVPIDLSKAIFIFSYNDEQKINPILLDRMYKIKMDGFKISEKIIIAQHYILPAIYKEFNFIPNCVHFSDDIIRHIINTYTKDNFSNVEQGVRILERCLETIIAKINVLRLYNENNNNFHASFINYPMQQEMQTDDNLSDNEDEYIKPVQAQPNINYEYNIPYNIPQLKFPLEITAQIVGQFLVEPKTNPSLNMMYI
jgi:ATP-dependent Lon protease